MNKINLLSVIILMFTCAAVISCGFALNQPLNPDYYVQFRINKPNFARDDWKYFSNSHYDTIEISNYWVGEYRRRHSLNRLSVWAC